MCENEREKTFYTIRNMPKNAKQAKSNAEKAPTKAITLLLTGFDAFAGEKYNPSQLVVESFPDILKSKPREQSLGVKEIYVHKLVLPTAGPKGWKVLKKALDDTVAQAEGPVIVLMLGLAAMRENMSLERFAMNYRDYRAADNSGERRLDETIDPRAPQLLRTNLDLPHLKYMTVKAGFPCDISNHAGTFVCNELYFRALNYKRGANEIRSVLFMHLPREKVFAKTAKKVKTEHTPKDVAEKLKGVTKAGKKKQVALLCDAVIEVVENMAHEYTSRPVPRRK
jgi:pyroglutamyl-peptidase